MARISNTWGSESTNIHDDSLVLSSSISFSAYDIVSLLETRLQLKVLVLLIMSFAAARFVYYF